MRSFIPAIAMLGLASIGLAAEPGSTVTFRVEGVQSGAGHVIVGLCGDPAAPFPGGCRTYGGRAAAVQGATTVTVEGVANGDYAVQAFHDANGNGRADIPPEGFAFGNNAPFPPSFDAAKLHVGGATESRLAVTYITGGNGPTARRIGSQGAPAPQGVQRVDVREQGLYGELYVPAGGAGKPALLLIGGSEGGLDTISQMATSFAKEGFVCLALAYWAEKDLPETLENIPLEYFDRAITWLQARAEVSRGSSGIGMVGWSRGAEASLIVAARNPRVRAVVAVAPSSVVWEGLSFQTRPNQSAWTVGGKPLPSLTPASSNYRNGDRLADLFIRSFDAVEKKPQAAIAVEKIRGGILLISGGDDNIWPATRFSDRIMARLQTLDFKGNYTHLDYPQAGHAVFVGAPDSPMAGAMRGVASSTLGGDAAANTAAWNDSWPKTLAFLRTELQDAQR